MASLQINELLRLTSPKIFGAVPVRMLTHPPLYVGGNPGIEGIVGTKYDVNLPIHFSDS
jgi:hypothetical protein